MNSNLMWLLPTRGRPQLCQDALNACKKANMTSQMIVMVDDRVDDYPDLMVPKNVSILRKPFDMADCMRYVFDHFPNEKFYGWLSDDHIPVTNGFDVKLEKNAGDWFLADCRDDYIGTVAHQITHTLSGAFCWGGDLVRAVGWWALPEVRQAGVDDAWVEICVRRLSLRKYDDQIYVEHHNYRTGKREKDETDSHERDGENYIHHDFEIYRRWKQKQNDVDAADRIIEAMNKVGFELP